MAKEENYGIVYLLTNEAMPGMVKIGMTSRNDLQSRLDELYTTGVPLPFTCACSCKVPLNKMAELEAALHAAFAPKRVNPKREFFNISPEQVIPLLKFANCGDMTDEVNAELNKNVSPEELAAAKQVRFRRPALNFIEMGFSIGDELIYRDDENIRVRIISEKRVDYNGETWALSTLVKSLRSLPYNVAPDQYWHTIDGRSLSDIYEETYPLSAE